MENERNFIESLKDKKTQEDSFEILLNKYKEPLYWHIRKLVLNHDDANDILQNTFVKVFRGISEFKSKSKLYTWIYRIATNESLNFLKSKSKKFSNNSNEMMDYLVENLKNDPYFDGNELQLKLQSIISKLPEKQKLVFQMKYEQNMKFKEIAEILGKSIGGLKASYHIAVSKIKKEISQIQTF